MSPITNVSDILRLPRLGKIRLGIKVEKDDKSYPKAVDYFVCPPEVLEVYGEEPRELQIMFPVENHDEFAQQWLRAYSLTQGLICIGDGVSARQKTDVATKKPVNHDTKDWDWVEGLVCDPQECPLYARKQCRRVLNLQFLLPDVPGLGVWQIDTTSFYSIVNINSMIYLVKNLCGRVAMVPLTLCIGPIEVTPRGMKKKTVYVMHIKQDIKLADLQKVALLPAARVLIPEPEATEPPGDLYPEEVLDVADAGSVGAKDLHVEPPPLDPAATQLGTATTGPGQPETKPPVSKEQLEWGIIRTIQKVRNFTDSEIKSAFRLDFPELKGKLKGGALTDTVPDLLTLKMLTPIRFRLENYQRNVSKLTEKQTETGAKAGGEGQTTPPQSNSEGIIELENTSVAAWDEALQLIGELGATENQLQVWWARHKINVRLSDFEVPFPMATMTQEMISSFRDALREVKDTRDQAQRNKPNLI